MSHPKLVPAAVPLLIILFINQATSQVKDDFDPAYLCTLIANGTKIKDPKYCNSYIECVDLQPISHSCGDEFYDRNSGKCVAPQDISCLSSDPCAANPDGFNSDPYSCNGYYYCNSGSGVRGECSAGMNYNPETQNCIRGFPCEITMYPEDACNVIPDGVFIKVPRSCRDYQLCWKSELISGTCPNGFYLNTFAGTCDYPQLVDCVEEIIPEPEVPEDVKCTQADVFIADGQTCNGYYYCQSNRDGDFKLIHNNCPANRFFDASNGGACVKRTEIACPYDRCVTLGLEFIQLANVNDDGCVGFSICQNGEKIGHDICPDGQYFDEILQLCTENIVTFPACIKTTATQETVNNSTGDGIIKEVQATEDKSDTSNPVSNATEVAKDHKNKKRLSLK